jgi:hypothetical protein
MIDMGPYFEPPRKAAMKRWRVMKALVDSGFRFNTKEAKGFIESRILIVKNPRLADVIERIKDERLRDNSS